ncbi:MAG: SdrD B-like domain-containing protein [Gemmataceae bacterium]
MFDSLKAHLDATGDRPRGPARARLGIENLENREVPAVIGGIVYNDANGNGLFDSGEQAVANSRLYLYNASNQVVASTTSDSAGFYRFTQLGNGQVSPGTVTKVANFDTAKTDHTRSATIQQFDSSLGTLTAVEIIAEGQLNSSIQMENLEDVAAALKAELRGSLQFQVGGTVLQDNPQTTVNGTLSAFDGQADLSGSSARDFGTTTLRGAFTRTVLTNSSDLAAFTGSGTIGVSELASMKSCLCGTGNHMGAIRTTASGRVSVVYHYTPNGSLPIGDYTVVQSPQPAGYRDGKESSNGNVIPNSDRTDSIRVSITSYADQSTQNNFGEVKISTLSGRVYWDRDKGGSYSAGDTAIAGVRVLLSGSDAFGNLINRSTFTNALGMYAFTNLTPGTYTITEVQPAGYLQGTNSEGTPAGTISGDTTTVTLDQGTSGSGYDFGEIRNTVTPPPGPIVTPPVRPSKFFLLGNFRGW